jgi:hypothetical protein
MHWELWDTESGNLVATFSTEDEALAGVRDVISVNAPDYFDFLSLGAAFSEGEAKDYELPPVLDGEALRARLAETAPQVQASRAMHGRIRTWLLEEEWQIRDVPDPRSLFNIMVTLQDGREVNIYRYKDHRDHITVHVHLVVKEPSRSEFAQIAEKAQKDLLWSVFRDLSMMNIDFEGLTLPLHDMRYRTYVYFDGLTKDSLIQAILLVLRAVSLSIQTLARGLEHAGRPAEATSGMLRLVHRAEDAPGSGNSLTAAS